MGPRGIIPEGYDDFLRDLKQRIRTAQMKAALAVNRELILLYWYIGREILERQNRAGWGAKIMDRLSSELEAGLLEHLRKFLLELGVGFAFVGSQYRLEVGGEDFKMICSSTT